MAIQVTRVYREHFPALRLIGKRYTNDDRGEDGFGRQWDEWWRENRFDRLMQAASVAPVNEDTLGLMTARGDMTGFTYWIGLFFPAETKVPEGTTIWIFRRVILEWDGSMGIRITEKFTAARPMRRYWAKSRRPGLAACVMTLQARTAIPIVFLSGTIARALRSRTQQAT